jgi:competence protein ComEC
LFLRGGALLRQLIALSCIWIFCFIAGAEASVLRAGIMFTAIALGRWMERPISGMQALGLSMLILLIADPDWLFDPGFQLSHAAVAGILLLHPVLVNVIRPQNRLLKSTWESACMTLAATACTLPLTSYYFHQFPWLFLPANLIAVPLSSLALLGLFFLIPLSIFQLPSEPITWAITCVLDGMNAWVEQLDPSRVPFIVGKHETYPRPLSKQPTSGKFASSPP